MTIPQLDALFKLHLVDVAIAEIKARASHLDPGRALIGEIQRIEADLSKAKERLQVLEDELAVRDKSLQDIDAKIRKVNHELYHGVLISAKEAETLKSEIDALHRQREANDARVLELWELTPPEQEAVAGIETQLAELRLRLDEHRKGVLGERAKLEEQFKNLLALRPSASEGIPDGLLKQYEAIRSRATGVGMTRITAAGACEQCGMAIPEKAKTVAQEGRIANCESCRRILYWEPPA